MRYGSVCSGIEAATAAWHRLGWEAAWYSEIEPFPKAVLAHHYPGVPDLGDMTAIADKIKSGEVEAPDILVGGTPCFPSGTFVLCRRGLIPIQDVVVGDSVWTHNNRWRKVTEVMSRIADTIVVRGQGHPGLETTFEHPFYVRSKCARSTRVKNKPVRLKWTTEPEWIEAGDLKGRFWSTPTAFPRSEIPKLDIRSYEGRNLPKAFDEDFFWFLGAWLGDGWLRQDQRSKRPEGQTRGTVLLCGNKRDREFISEKIARTGLAFSTSEERTTTRFEISSKPLTRWIDTHFGKYSDGKRIPAWMLGVTKDLKKAFLDGYMFADGGRYRQKKGGWMYRAATINRNLSVSIRMLYATIGRASTIAKVEPHRELTIEGRRVSERPWFQISVYDKSRSAFFSDGFLWGKVRKIKPGRMSIRVYNIEVEEDHSYTADGIVVHNCQSFSIAGLRESLDDHRGNLALEYVRLANAIDDVRLVRGQPGVITVWENVPGVLNTKDNAFGCFLGGLAGEDVPLEPPGRRWTDAGFVLGPKRTVAWRCQDAQYSGLAQRRKRVFVISGPRDFRPQEVLFEFGGSRRDSPPSREAQQDASGTLEGSPAVGGGEPGDERVRSALPFDTTQITSALNYSHPKVGDPCHPLASTAHAPAAVIAIQDVRVMEKRQNGRGWNDDGVSYTVDAAATQGVAYGCDLSQKAEGVGFKEEVSACVAPGTHPGHGNHVVYRDGAGSAQAFKASHFTRGKDGAPSEVYPPLTKEADKGDQDPLLLVPSSGSTMVVRRLTPEECESLMGFPRGYTKVPWKGKPAEDCPDTLRYKAIGNSFAVPIVAWIGKRIDQHLKGRVA